MLMKLLQYSSSYSFCLQTPLTPLSSTRLVSSDTAATLFVFILPLLLHLRSDFLPEARRPFCLEVRGIVFGQIMDGE